MAKPEEDRVISVYPTLANVNVKLPRRDKQNSVWMCDVMVYPKHIRSEWRGEGISRWNQRILEEISGRSLKDFKILFGQLNEFETSTVETLKEEFPEQYAKWRKLLRRAGDRAC